MTAPDSFCSDEAGSLVMSDLSVRIGLCGRLRPDHLAVIAARDWSGAATRGLDLVLYEPAGSYDVLAALARGDCDLALAAPFDVLSRSASDVEAMGSLFETTGGVLVREDRLARLRAGELLHVAVEASAPLTDSLCRRIVQVWAGAEGFAVAGTQIAIEPLAAGAAQALKAGYDAAFPCTANIDEVAARHAGLGVRLLTTEDAGLPGFAALELVAPARRSAEASLRVQAIVASLEESAARLQADPPLALALWRAAAGDLGEDAKAIVAATLPCLKAPLNRAPGRFRALEALLQDA